MEKTIAGWFGSGPMKVGDRVIIIDGSSDGHSGTITLVRAHNYRIMRDDGIEVDVTARYVYPKDR